MKELKEQIDLIRNRLLEVFDSNHTYKLRQNEFFEKFEKTVMYFESDYKSISDSMSRMMTKSSSIPTFQEEYRENLKRIGRELIMAHFEMFRCSLEELTFELRLEIDMEPIFKGIDIPIPEHLQVNNN